MLQSPRCAIKRLKFIQYSCFPWKKIFCNQKDPDLGILTTSDPDPYFYFGRIWIRVKVTRIYNTVIWPNSKGQYILVWMKITILKKTLTNTDILFLIYLEIFCGYIFSGLSVYDSRNFISVKLSTLATVAFLMAFLETSLLYTSSKSCLLNLLGTQSIHQYISWKLKNHISLFQSHNKTAKQGWHQRLWRYL